MRLDQPGIYFVINLATGKLYVGQTINLKTRLAGHFNSLKRGRHINRHLQSSFDKHGESNFYFYVAEFCAPHALTKREQYWIDFFGTRRIYNLAPAAGSCLGVKHLPSFGARMSAAKKGMKQPEHVCRAVAIANSVRIISNETRAKLSAALKRRVCTPETRRKLSAANKGRPLSEQQKKKLSVARSMSLSARGRTMTIAEWAAATGIPATAIAKRLRYGWSIDEAVSRPARANKRRVGASLGAMFHESPNRQAA